MYHKLSVVTVAYNAQDVIEKTIASVLSQKNVVYEYIIKDGGSYDATNEIIQRYQDKFAQNSIRLLHVSSKDKGIYDAMNEAIEICQGNWIIFLNAGDIFFSDSVLKQLVENIETNSKADVVYGDSVSVYAKKEVLCTAKSEDLIHRMSLCHQACCISSDIMKKYRYDDKYKIGADYDFFLKAYLEKCSFRKVPFIVCKYDKNGLSSKELAQSYLEFLRIRKNNGLKIPNKLMICIRYFWKCIRQRYEAEASDPEG